MVKQLNTRSEKVKFLTDLANGRTSIDVLCDKPHRIELWKQQADERYYSIGTDIKTEEELEAEDKTKKYKNRFRIMVRYCSVPLAFRETDVDISV